MPIFKLLESTNGSTYVAFTPNLLKPSPPHQYSSLCDTRGQDPIIAKIKNANFQTPNSTEEIALEIMKTSRECSQLSLCPLKQGIEDSVKSEFSLSVNACLVPAEILYTHSNKGAFPMNYAVICALSECIIYNCIINEGFKDGIQMYLGSSINMFAVSIKRHNFLPRQSLKFSISEYNISDMLYGQSGFVLMSMARSSYCNALDIDVKSPNLHTQHAHLSEFRDLRVQHQEMMEWMRESSLFQKRMKSQIQSLEYAIETKKAYHEHTDISHMTQEELLSEIEICEKNIFGWSQFLSLSGTSEILALVDFSKNVSFQRKALRTLLEIFPYAYHEDDIEVAQTFKKFTDQLAHNNVLGFYPENIKKNKYFQLLLKLNGSKELHEAIEEYAARQESAQKDQSLNEDALLNQYQYLFRGYCKCFNEGLDYEKLLQQLEFYCFDDLAWVKCYTLPTSQGDQNASSFSNEKNFVLKNIEEKLLRKAYLSTTEYVIVDAETEMPVNFQIALDLYLEKKTQKLPEQLCTPRVKVHSSEYYKEREALCRDAYYAKLEQSQDLKSCS